MPLPHFLPATTPAHRNPGRLYAYTPHSDPTEELLMIIGIFSHFFALETTLAERQFFRALAKLIGRRAARMSACGIAAIVSKMGYLEDGCSVGADGSLYNVRILPSVCAELELELEEDADTLFRRNILALRIGCMKACVISLGTRESESCRCCIYFF